MLFRYNWVFILIIVQIVFLVYWSLKKNRTTYIFPDSSKKVLNILQKNIDESRLRWKNKIILTGLLILAISASGPQIGKRVRPIERKGVDLVIALDTSTSMDAQDVTPSRILKAKFELGRLIQNLKGDRVSIIVFAGTSHMYLPLTTDYDAALLFLNAIDTDIIPTQGTSLSSAMSTAISAFTEESDKFKVMLLVTDGEDHEGQAIELAEKASEIGLVINTIGVGSKIGSLIPDKSKNSSLNQYKRDIKGKLITSTLNENILIEIAQAGQGSFFRFDNNRDTFIDISEAINRMEKKTISTHEFSEYEDRFQPIALLAFCLLIWGFIIPTRPK